jgi:hypothetical protein
MLEKKHEGKHCRLSGWEPFTKLGRKILAEIVGMERNFNVIQEVFRQFPSKA